MPAYKAERPEDPIINANPQHTEPSLRQTSRQGASLWVDRSAICISDNPSNPRHPWSISIEIGIDHG